MFRVDVDEKVDGGTLTLNGTSAHLMKNVDGSYWAKWDRSDADGEIQIMFPDGGTTTCRIGYVTHGLTVQEFVVRSRRCEQVAT
jgi:hypothetical protein